MAELKDLYQEAVLDHYRRPHNFRELERSNRHALGFNAFCGDKLTVYALVEDGIIRDLSFVGTGCAISIASASMMTESLKGKSEADAKIAVRRLERLLDRSSGLETDTEGLGEIAVLATLRGYPVRAKCATLAWHTLHAALEQREETATTE